MGARRTKAVEVERKPEKQQALSSAFVGGIFGSIVVIVVGTILIGKSDSGEINVNAAIQNSNQANIDAGGDASNNVGLVREDLRNLPNGGLVPTGSPTDTPTPEVTPDDQGTTTESTDTATRTPDTTAEGDETSSSATPESAEGTEAVSNSQ